MGNSLTKPFVEQIKQNFLAFWENYLLKDLELDFQDVKKIDRDGLELLLMIENKASTRGVKTIITKAELDIIQIFKAIGIDQKFLFGWNGKRVSDL